MFKFYQIPPCAITLAVKEFQVFNNLEPTGRLTKETRELMAKDRCGNPDVKCGGYWVKLKAEKLKDLLFLVSVNLMIPLSTAACF